MKRVTSEGGPDPGDKPKPDIRPPDEEPKPERKEPEPSEQPGRPNPDGVPNEIRATDGRYKYRGGRQGQGGVPNPDDADDRESAGSFRGTADQDIGADDYKDDYEQSTGAWQSRNTELNGQTRNLE